ncbi:MAG TPA: CRISPR-associated endonuclease Cas3'' [Desulfatiglandales bacterium]|nr:CRISPR-associated endonuclease Cas3'' [Desulfatiglandales bacterium]
MPQPKKKNRFVVKSAAFCVLACLGIVVLKHYLTCIPPIYIRCFEGITIIGILVFISRIFWHKIHKKPASLACGDTQPVENKAGGKMSVLDGYNVINCPDGTRHIDIEDLSRLWVDTAGTKNNIKANQEHQRQETTPPQKKDKEQEKDKEQKFTHPDITEYYHNNIMAREVGFMNEPARLSTVTEILDLIDRYGECPSVVDLGATYSGADETEPDYKWYKVSVTEKSTTWDILRMCTLREHLLNVAKKVESMYPEDIRAPLFIIVALAHDFGKIPEFREKGYIMGDHPIISMEILKNKVPAFNNLPEQDMNNIMTAVLNHHRSETENEWTNRLQKADRDCRQQELTKYTSLKGEKYIETEEIKNLLNPPRLWDREQEELSPESSVQSEYERVDMSWFDTDEFFEKLKPRINKLSDDGKSFNVISMPDGNVYVWINVVTEILLTLAGERQELNILALASNNQGERSLLISAVGVFRDKNCIDKGKIQDGYFGRWFEVLHQYPTNEKDKKYRKKTHGFFGIPFRIGNFNCLPSNLEKTKRDDFIKSIKSFSISTKKRQPE